MAKGSVENNVLIVRGNDILQRFAYVAEKGKKMPAKMAEEYLKDILSNKDHEYHKDLLEGKLEKMSTHPEKIQPSMKFAL